MQLTEYLESHTIIREKAIHSKHVFNKIKIQILDFFSFFCEHITHEHYEFSKFSLITPMWLSFTLRAHLLQESLMQA